MYIRTDMNDIIATGHVMRCLSIADAARDLGETVTFLLADGQAAEYITDRGYEAVVLGTKWNDMESELPVLLEIIKERNISSILIDSYQVTEAYLKRLSEHVKTVYIDDLNLFAYPVDMLICYANYWKKFGYKERYPNTKLLLGTKYMPLRGVFSNMKKKQIKEQIENVLLLSGGSDKYHALDCILEKIKEKDLKKIEVICGRYYEGYEEFAKKYNEYEHIYIYRAVENIESYMQEADLAVSAGGTTLYELCACGTPAISYTFADNQLENVKQFDKDGMIAYAGDVRDSKIQMAENISQCIDRMQVFEIRKELSCKMQELVDGKGAKRIAEQLIQMK